MIRVTIGDNLSRETVIVSGDNTLRSVLEDNGIDYSARAMHLDGTPLSVGDLDKKFSDFGIKDRCFLISVLKADNAYI